MINFTKGVTLALRVLVAEITIVPKTMNSTFFIMDTKLAYFVLLRSDSIHSSQNVPSTLHEQLMFFKGDQVSIILTYECPFSIDVRME